MALNLKKSEAARDAEMQAIVDLIGASGTLEIYDGTQPTNPDTALGAQNLLAVLTLANPCGTVNSGVLTFDTITGDASADASGDATWFSLKDSMGNRVAEGTVGESDANMIIDEATIVAGQQLNCSGLTLTAGDA